MAYVLNHCTLEGRGSQISEFMASLVYMVIKAIL